MQGAGAALMLPLALALLTAAFPPERRAWAIGIFSGVTGIAVLGGPVVGGAVAQGMAWQWIFWLNVPIGLVMIPLILARIPVAERSARQAGPGRAAPGDRRRPGPRLGADPGQQHRLGQPGDRRHAGGRALLGAAFVAWELRAAQPMVPLRLFRSRPSRRATRPPSACSPC